jgi:hypothetical protein
MNNVALRHRLPPRANPTGAFSPPRSPQPSNPPTLSDLDAFVPSIESKTQPTWSRESWLVYMNALDNGERARDVERPGALHEEEELHPSGEIVEETPQLQLDLGGPSSRSRPLRRESSRELGAP